MSRRSNLLEFLSEFIAQRRGLRRGTMFGRPAGYAGRRVFAWIDDDGLAVRLPEEMARAEVRAGRAVRRRRSRVGRTCWVTYARQTSDHVGRIGPVLEQAARCVVAA